MAPPLPPLGRGAAEIVVGPPVATRNRIQSWFFFTILEKSRTVKAGAFPGEKVDDVCKTMVQYPK